MRVKANLMSDTQKLIRENIFKSKTHDGATLYQHNDERSFVIEPLADVQACATTQQPLNRVERQVVTVPVVPQTTTSFMSDNVASLKPQFSDRR